MRYLSTQWEIFMPNILAAIIVTITYLAWGLWMLDRKPSNNADLDLGFFISLTPVALLTWYALYLVRA